MVRVPDGGHVGVDVLPDLPAGGAGAAGAARPRTLKGGGGEAGGGQPVPGTGEEQGVGEGPTGRGGAEAGEDGVFHGGAPFSPPAGRALSFIHSDCITGCPKRKAGIFARGGEGLESP